MRIHPTGELDPTFGSGGIVLTAVVAPGSKNSSAYAYTVAIYPNADTSSDKIYVAGAAQYGSTSEHFALIRYNLNGSLDTTFGSGGMVVSQNFSGSRNEVRAIAVQPADGKIVLAGWASTFHIPGSGGYVSGFDSKRHEHCQLFGSLWPRNGPKYCNSAQRWQDCGRRRYGQQQ